MYYAPTLLSLTTVCAVLHCLHTMLSEGKRNNKCIIVFTFYSVSLAMFLFLQFLQVTLNLKSVVNVASLVLH